MLEKDRAIGKPQRYSFQDKQASEKNRDTDALSEHGMETIAVV